MLENIQGDSWGLIPRMPSLLPHDLCHEWNASPAPGSQEPVCQCRRQKRPSFGTWVGKIPWRRKLQPTPVFLPGESHGQRSLDPMDRGLQSIVSRRVGHDWSDFTFTFHSHALEKEMATHSSVLAWRIPGTGKPGGLLSMGSHRVGYDWSDLAAAATILH